MPPLLQNMSKIKRNISTKINLPPRPKVFVGMSGGVDSSVAAALLVQQGYEVTGVFIKTWHPEWLPCTWKEERRDAMRVAAHLGIPFFTFDAEEVYRTEVAESMIADYSAGRTPNPDVLCNKTVKFGAFLDFALSQGADFVATGHYAICEKETFSLVESTDKEKDQTYFLWTLTRKQLKHILFPIGHYQKKQVRELAKKFGLPTFDKKDSQGICFLGEVDMQKFLERYITHRPGNVLNSNGEVIGTHTGALFYTIGTRRGFTITQKTDHDQSYYVVAKNVVENTLTVATEDQKLDFGLKNIVLTNHVWNLLPIKNQVYSARIRYRQKKQFCTLCLKQGGDKKAGRKWVVSFQEPQAALSFGQSLVVYDEKGRCLGGGILSEEARI
ncbi:MAG: tRNA 2-thiouridine(34) synthase MnmA [Candidatus Pacebacteria bacterium]|nr:tRNA 2-thiouridine(34) synthase MnmA [Candidatus Paceibacterota bacterium]